MIIDRLIEDIQAKSFVCVGLDPRLDLIPESFHGGSVSETLFSFNKEIIDATHDLAACFKPQIAFYEALGLEGLKAYARTVQYLRERGILVIGDIKRGDISSTADAYAKAHFTGDFEVDFITINPYMGYDTLDAYLPYLEKENKGVFVLVRTSNPGAGDIEGQQVSGQLLYEKIAEDLAQKAQDYLGKSGHSSLGFVFGGTQSEDIEAIRENFKEIPFLIPGYGAQGAEAADIKAYLGGGSNSIVNSSRGIIYAWRQVENGDQKVGEAARAAVQSMIKEIQEA